MLFVYILILLDSSYVITIMIISFKMVFLIFFLVCPLQVLCRHHRQYQHHQVCPLHLGNLVLQLTIVDVIAMSFFKESIFNNLRELFLFGRSLLVEPTF